MADRLRSHLFPSFAGRVHLVLAEMDSYATKHMPEVLRWDVSEGFRTVARQQELFALGRSRPGKIVTQRDGVRRRSDHQSSLAADLNPFDSHGPIWTVDVAHWAYLGHVARAHGLEWGGDWKMRDMPHVQWPESDKATYGLAREWQRSIGLR